MSDTDPYWMRRVDVEGERYVRVTDVVGYLLHTADLHGGTEGDLLRRAATHLSVILTWADLEPRE